MLTPWADTLDRAQPLPEYPRPQMVRDSYLNLNGPWSYAITTSAQKPAQADGTILVPFSPESELSGVGHVLQPEEYLWYIRTVTLPDGFNVGRVLLHFGAVDQIATVWCNGVELTTHTGGYLGAGQGKHDPCVRARRDEQVPAPARQADAAPARHLVHAAERHLADGLARERAAELYPFPARDAAVRRASGGDHR